MPTNEPARTFEMPVTLHKPFLAPFSNICLMDCVRCLSPRQACADEIASYQTTLEDDSRELEEAEARLLRVRDWRLGAWVGGGGLCDNVLA